MQLSYREAVAEFLDDVVQYLQDDRYLTAVALGLEAASEYIKEREDSDT